MPLYQLRCEECGREAEVRANYDLVKAGLPCVVCGNNYIIVPSKPMVIINGYSEANGYTKTDTGDESYQGGTTKWEP